jgi:hypothetical protein|tara:strand:+ start:81 stop:416 length:336 start_codon:yes stop_codon:yes gene_type:complete
MENRLVEHIWTILECREEQTKTIIEQLLNDIKLFDQKQADYGPYNIAKFGVIGVLVRTSDKIERLINLYRDHTLTSSSIPKPLNESSIDSWQDLSIYGAIARVLNEENWKT